VKTNDRKGKQVNPHKTDIVKRMIAQFYMDMCKDLLLLSLVFGLFDKSMQNSTMRPYFMILVLVATIVSGFFGYGMLRSFGCEKENHTIEK
jgi:hypothetical protein